MTDDLTREAETAALVKVHECGIDELRWPLQQWENPVSLVEDLVNALGDSLAGREDDRAEIQRMRAQLDEAQEQLHFIGAGSVTATREELVRRITAIGPELWKAGVWKSRGELEASRDLAEANVEIQRLRDQRDAALRVANRALVPEESRVGSHEWLVGFDDGKSAVGEAILRAALTGEPTP